MQEQKKPLVYFVDDETELLELFQLAVAGEFETQGFSNPCEFVEKIKTNEIEQPDIVVSDLMMPELNGLDMIVTLRQETDLSCPFILLSGHLSKENLIIAVDNGVEKVLEKPCDLAAISAGITEVFYKTEIRHIRADVRNTARKLAELCKTIEQLADMDFPELSELIDKNFLTEGFDTAETTFREELNKLETRLVQLIEQERILERLQKVS